MSPLTPHSIRFRELSCSYFLTDDVNALREKRADSTELCNLTSNEALFSAEVEAPPKFFDRLNLYIPCSGIVGLLNVIPEVPDTPLTPWGQYFVCQKYLETVWDVFLWKEIDDQNQLVRYLELILFITGYVKNGDRHRFDQDWRTPLDRDNIPHP